MCSLHFQPLFSFLFTLQFVFAITRHTHGNLSCLVLLPSVENRRKSMVSLREYLFSEQTDVSIPGIHSTMDSTASVKKCRIMIITDESIIEQIERAGGSSIFQSAIVIESKKDQIRFASSLVGIRDSSNRPKRGTIS